MEGTPRELTQETPTISSGVAFQNAHSIPVTYAVTIKGAGKCKIDIGDTEAAAVELGTEELVASQNRVVQLRLPGEWWGKLTLTTATFTGANKAIVGL